MYKTPRTLLENYLDVSNTQTVKTGRQGAYQRLIRTPEAPSSSKQSQIERRVSRTPEPYMNYSASKSVPHHDRVASLRGKRRSISSSLDVAETPRQLLEGFLEGADTTAPLIRYGSRIPERVSASQPAVSVGRSSSQYRPTADWTLDIDSETPRTLLQKFVSNTKETVDTPRFSPEKHEQDMHLSPEIPFIQDTYSTPSPFKPSSADSDGVSIRSVTSHRTKTPRLDRGHFTMNMTAQEMSLVDESVIAPTYPADYKTPSQFMYSSSDEDSFLPETQASLRAHRMFKLSVLPGDIHTLRNISGNFSPKISSTQKNVSMVMDDNLGSYSPDAVSPSPNVSSNISHGINTPQTTPRNLSHRSESPDMLIASKLVESPSSIALQKSSTVRTPLRPLNSFAGASPQSSVRSSGSRSSNRSRSSSLSRLSNRSRDATMSSHVDAGRQLMSGPHDNIHMLGNISGNFSPKISSTQKNVSMVMDDNLGSYSPDAVSPSPNVSSNISHGINTPQTTPRNLSHRSESPDMLIASKLVESPSSIALQKSSTVRTPLRPLNSFAGASPQSSVRSSGSRSSNRSRVSNRSKVRDETVASTIDSERQIFQEMEGDATDDDWQDEPDGMEIDKVAKQSRTLDITKPKKTVVRRPRMKSKYSMPTSVIKKHFTHFAGMRVSPEAIDAVMEISEKYWDNLASDLEAYAKHARRKQINYSDFALLFKRQGYVTEKQSLKSLIEKYLPMEEREKLIHVARAGNRIEPKL